MTGVGNVEYKANIAVVRLGVTLSGRNAAVVQARLATRSSRLVRYLRLQRVDKLETTGVSLRPQRNYSVSPPKIVGYSGSNTVSFEVPASRAGKILDGAVTNGASNIDNVSFKGAAATVLSARQRALRQATKRAQNEANTVAIALGKKLGGPINVRIDTFYNAPATESISASPLRSSAKRAPSTPVVGGTRNGRASVSIDFNIY